MAGFRSSSRASQAAPEARLARPGVDRRTFLRRSLGAAGMLAAPVSLTGCSLPFLGGGSSESPEFPVEGPEEALQRLIEGNLRFVNGQSKPINESADRRAQIVAKQRPFSMIFSCVDSRVPPELIFDRGLGDLFVIRTAGEVVDHAVMGSLEYGAYELEIPLLLVLGHKKCGAVKATLEAVESGGAAEGSIGYLVEALRPAVSGQPSNFALYERPIGDESAEATSGEAPSEPPAEASAEGAVHEPAAVPAEPVHEPAAAPAEQPAAPAAGSAEQPAAPAEQPAAPAEQPAPTTPLAEQPPAAQTAAPTSPSAVTAEHAVASTDTAPMALPASMHFPAQEPHIAEPAPAAAAPATATAAPSATLAENPLAERVQAAVDAASATTTPATAAEGDPATSGAASAEDTTVEHASESAREAASAHASESGAAETSAEETVTEEIITEPPADAAAAEGAAAEGADPLTEAIKRNVELVVERLSASAIIAERVKKERLLVVGAIYDLETGLVELTANIPKAFLPQEAAAAKG